MKALKMMKGLKDKSCTGNLKDLDARSLKRRRRHDYSVNSFKGLIYLPTVSLGLTSPQLIKIEDMQKGSTVMCALMHSHCPCYEKILPLLLIIYFSVGSQLRALQSCSVGEKYLHVIRISFFKLCVQVFIQYRSKRKKCVN